MFNVKRVLIFFVTAIPAVLLFSNCGLEEYPYIESLSQSNISRSIPNTATIKIPSSFTGSGLSGFHFIIFYRIYISDESGTPAGYTTDGNSSYYIFNPQLASDYNYFKNLIDNNSIDDMDKLFRNRGYKYLCLENDEDIDALLNSSVLGKSISFEFPSSYSPDQYPKMTINNISHNLFRSTDNGGYRALPSRYFLYKKDSWSSKVEKGDERIDDSTNADVNDKVNIAEGERYHAYTAMYIAATAIDDTNYSYIYSTPEFIHVIRLTQND